MKNRLSVFSVCCVVFFFVFSAFMIWYLPAMSSIHAKTEETIMNLETSRGRELRQKSEYDKAAEELPIVQTELLEKQPLAEAAELNVTELKARRKELREEKKRIEKLEYPDLEKSGEQDTEKKDGSNAEMEDSSDE